MACKGGDLHALLRYGGGVKQYLHTNKIGEMTDRFKTTMVRAVTENEEVPFYWCMLTAETEDEDARAVFGMVVDLWITIRGFSFTCSWLEVYK